jgi:tetratricopeptide (TPR) repeat protein
VKYCHACGCKLPFGIEKFCPNCGQNLVQEKEEVNGIDITDTKGDVIGVGITGTGNIIGKEIDYTVKGNVIHLNISGGNISNEIIDSLQKIINMPTQIDQKSLTKDKEYDNDKLDETNDIQKQITSILQEVDNIEKKEGIKPIEVIKSENLQISMKELLLKVHILKGNGYYYKNEHNKAIQCYDKAIEIDPNYADAWYNKGVTLYRLGKHNDEAIQCYDKAIEIDPNYADAWYNKGVTLYRLGKHNDEAIQCYDKAIEIDPHYIKAWYNKGLALSISGKYKEAIHCYDQVIAIDPNSSKAWNNKGNALDDLGKYDEAIHCYDKAITIEPHKIDAWYNKGLALSISGKYKEAIHCYDQVIAIDPKYAGVWFHKGVTLYRLGKHNEAIQCYDKALEIEPNNELFNKNRNIVLEKQRKTLQI